MTNARTPRISSLDGLRGLAAVMVLIHHVLLVSPSLYDAYTRRIPGGEWTGILVFSPIHLLWDGSEAVIVFFVLSGFVLSLAAKGLGAIQWPGFLCRRIIRLYIPVWAALLFAFLSIVLVGRRDYDGLSGWLAGRDTDRSPLDLFLVFGTSRLDSPLWSLSWEVSFSLLLPAYLILARALSRRSMAWYPYVAILGLAVISQFGSSLGRGWLQYLPIFGVGVAIYYFYDDIRGIYNRLGVRLRFLLVIAALFLLGARWWVPGMESLYAMTVLGASWVVVCVLFELRAGSLMNARILQWLGKVSFSLYIVHEPIVVSTAFALKSDNALLVGIIAVPLAMFAAYVFYFAVEKPSIELSRQAGRLISRALSARIPLK